VAAAGLPRDAIPDTTQRSAELQDKEHMRDVVSLSLSLSWHEVQRLQKFDKV